MCRSIKTLRPPYTEAVTTDDIDAAALQYVRKVAGMRKPATKNQAAFEAAVEQVSAATRDLLDRLELRPAVRSAAQEIGGKSGARPST